MIDPAQSFLGYKLIHLLAGLSGGLMRALVKGESIGASVVSILAGMLASMHITPFVMEWLNFRSENADLALGFLIGVTAMILAEGAMKWAREWSRHPTLPGGLK